MNETERLRLECSLLRVLSSEGLFRSREAFEAVGRVVMDALGADHVAIFLPDAPGHARLYASLRAIEPTMLAFGERVPIIASVHARVYGEGELYFQPDGSTGSPLERLAAEFGFRSFVEAPLRAGPDAPVLGDLSVIWREAGACERVDRERLAVVAAAIGGHLPGALEAARARRLAEIVLRGDDAVLAWDRDGVVTETTPAVERVFGVHARGLVGARLDRLFEPGEQAGQRRLARFWVGSDAAGAEPCARPHAGLRRVEVIETPVEDDPLVHRYAILRDVSDVELAEALAVEGFRRARDLENQNRALLDNAPIIFFRLGDELELTYLNAHAERLLGVSLERELGARLRDRHVDPEGMEAFDVAVERARAGRMSQPYEARLRRESGEPITLRGTLYPLLGDEGAVLAIEGVLVDVSDERIARRRLVQSDRLSTLGTLAAGVAHELNNPAAFALIGIDVLDRLVRQVAPTMEPVTAGQIVDLLAELRGGIRRIVEIAKDLRTFAAPAPGSRTMVDVNRAVESAITLTRSKVLERADLDLRLGDVPVVMMEDGRLTQVVVNLLVNASQSIPKRGKGRVTVSTAEGDGFVEVAVSDTGSGIPPENLERIFTPFFTTKEAEEGTGLGLAISREIVERAGGVLAAESPWPPGVEGGARFVIRLPVGEPRAPLGPRAAAPAQPAESPPPRRRARRRVLIVDDEPTLARVLALELEGHHEISVATSAEAALRAIGEAAFDVVVCDLLMPGTTGPALREIVRERRPPLAERFVFMTGVGFGRELAELRSTGAPVLEKPFRLGAVLREIDRVADGDTERQERT